MSTATLQPTGGLARQGHGNGCCVCKKREPVVSSPTPTADGVTNGPLVAEAPSLSASHSPAALHDKLLILPYLQIRNTYQLHCNLFITVLFLLSCVELINIASEALG